jgi:hypothetical protein
MATASPSRLLGPTTWTIVTIDLLVILAALVLLFK